MSGTVTVGCNYPNGLILRLHDFIEAYQPVQNGGTRLVKMPVPREGSEVKLRGPVVAQGVVPKYQIIGRRPREGYGLTRVDAEWFNEWYEQNKNTAIVKNKVVIVHSKDTAGMAKEMQDIRSGMEPLNPEMKTGTDGKQAHADARISNRITTRPKDEGEESID